MTAATKLFTCAALAALLAPCAAGAGPEPQGGAAPDAQAVWVPGFGVAAAPAQLEGARGGSDTMTASAAQRGAVTGNSAANVVTGGNTIDAGSFAGAAGIPIVIQNSGANVLIQNATVINLQFRD